MHAAPTVAPPLYFQSAKAHCIHGMIRLKGAYSFRLIASGVPIPSAGELAALTPLAEAIHEHIRLPIPSVSDPLRQRACASAAFRASRT